MKARNITNVERPKITIDIINDLLAKIEDIESVDTWIGDDDYDINVYDNEYHGDGTVGLKYTVYRVVDGNPDVSEAVANGDIDL